MSKIVRKLRMERGWTQEHLAELTGLSVRSIQRIERGQTCSLETQNALAAVFEIDRSTFNSEDASTNEVASPPDNLAANVYEKGIEGFLVHACLFGFSAAIGFVIGFSQAAVFWCLVGWSIGLLTHGFAAFGLLPIDPVSRRLGRQASFVVLQCIDQFGRVSMKTFARLSGSAALLAGVALLAWVSYDATDVMQSLGLQARMDEAAVASIALLFGSALVMSGIFVWRRILRSSPVIAS